MQALPPPATPDQARFLARSLVAARRDLLPERDRLDEFERLAAGVYALREMGADVRPIMRTLSKRDGKKYVAYVMEVGSLVLAMNGVEGWDEIIHDILELESGQPYAVGMDQEMEKFLFLDMSFEVRPVFSAAVASDTAFLQALLLQQDTSPAPQMTKRGRL